MAINRRRLALKIDGVEKMEEKKKKRRLWGCLSFILLILLSPLLFYFFVGWSIERSMNTPAGSKEAERAAASVISKYESNPVDSDESFVERYVELAPLIPEIFGHPIDRGNYIELEDIHNILEEPTQIFQAFTIYGEQDDIKYIYNHYPYIAEIEFVQYRKPHLDYYTDIYYEPHELDKIFYKALNEYRDNKSNSPSSYLENASPSKIRQRALGIEGNSGSVHYLMSRNLNEFESLEITAYNSIFDYFPDIAKFGKLDEHTFEISRRHDYDPIVLDSTTYNLINGDRQVNYELLRNNSIERFDINQLGTTINQINDTFDQEPYLYNFNTIIISEPNILSVHWKLTDNERSFDLEAEINLAGQTNLTKEVVQELPIESLVRNRTTTTIEWQEIDEVTFEIEDDLD